jgi:hypothetical protein
MTGEKQSEDPVRPLAESSLCVHLRTKAMYLPPNPRADGRAPQGSPTAGFAAWRR